MKLPGIPGFADRAPAAPNTYLRSESESPGILVVELGRPHNQRLVRHFIALASEDRRLRFGSGIHDQAIRSYVSRIDYDRDAVFGVLDDDLAIIGAAHLARGDGSAELGLSVSPGDRGRGIGAALLRRSHLHARNWGVRELFMHCLAENGPVMHLARKQGMQIATAAGDADAWLKLPPADVSSQVRAMIEQRIALIDYALKSQLAQGRRFAGVFMPRVYSRGSRG